MEEENKESVNIEEIARSLTYRSDDRMVAFRDLSLPIRSAVFNILSPNLRQEILSALSFNESVELLDHLDLRRVHHILAKMKDKKRREKLVGRIKSERFEKIEYFLQFHPQADISLLHLNYVILTEENSVKETSDVIEDYIHNTGKMPVVLVSKDGQLIGEVPFTELVKGRSNTKLRNYVVPIKTSVYNAKKEDIMSLFVVCCHEKVVVTDTDGSVMGFIYVDDVVDLFDEQPASSLYTFANVESSERPFDGVWDKVMGRYRWLIINLLTCFLAAGVVSFFQGAIDKLVVLAVLMPIVGGMGGNASTQTLAVTVRGIAIGEINLKNCRPAIVNEVLAGLINGLITGILLIPISLMLGVGFSVAILGTITVIMGLMLAGFVGTLTPLILKHLGKDPATSAGILISTFNDVTVYFLLLGLATLFLL